VNKGNDFSLMSRLKSFSCAINGFKILVREEHNARIHLIAAILVIVLGFVFQINMFEWVSIIFSIGLVFAFELINSALENIADFVSDEKHILIKKAKDMAAGAVLSASITAFVIGIIIFLPKLLKLVS